MDRLSRDLRHAVAELDANLTGGQEPERVRAASVTPNLFDVLRAPAALGRVVRADDTDAIVLSHGLWQRRFGGAPDIVGRTIQVNGAWGNRSFTGVGRLRDDLAPAAVAGEFAAIAEGWVKAGVVRAQPDGSLGGLARRAVPVHDFITGGSRTALWILLGSVAFVLLIACANVANLQLARADARRREVAVRAARGDIVRQLLTESVLLSTAGAVAGLGVAWAALQIVIQIARRGLVVVQTASSVVLALTAGLLIRCLLELNRIDLGFNPTNVLTAQLQVPATDYRLPADVVSDVRAMTAVAAGALAQPRFVTFLLGGFAAVALALVAIGIYGTISLLVAERSPEMGIRLALGAERASILKLILGQGLWLTVAGLVLGLAGAVFLTRTLAGLVYGVGTLDPLTFAAVPTLLCVVALLACLVPAVRAASIDPITTLRQ